MRLTINQKLFLWFASFSSVLVIAGSAAFYHAMRLVLLDNSSAELVATVTEKEASLESWFDERSNDIRLMASADDVRQALSDLTGPEEAQRRSGRERLWKAFSDRMAGQSDFATLSLLDYDSGIMVVSAGTTLDKTDWSREAVFVNGKTGIFLQTPYRLATSGQPVLMISAPVSTLDGRPAGVLVAVFKVGVLDEILARRGYVRETDEAFLVNSANFFVTQPRLDGKYITVLETKVEGPGVNSCLVGNSGTDISPDYRNVQTINAYRWIPNYGLCLVVKVDQAEALRPANQLLPLIMLASFAILVMGLVVAGLIARTITRPVLALMSSAEQLAAGKRDVQLKVSSHDELGLLATAFNSMSAALAEQERQLRGYAARLEEKVELRTAELHASEALGRAVIENSPVGISVRDGKGNLIFWNEAWMAIYSTDEAELQQFRENPDSPRARHILKGELDQDVEYFQLEGGLFIPEMEIEDPRHNASRWISEYSYAIPNLKGKIDRVVALTEDITERKLRQREMETLLAFSAAVRAAETRLELEGVVLDQVREMIGVENVGIILRDPADFDIIRGRGCGLWAYWSETICQSADVGIAGDVLRTGKMYVTEDVRSDPRLHGDNIGDVYALSLVPLVNHEIVSGAIVIGARAPFNETQLRLFRAMGDLVANAFYRLSLSELTERRLQWLTAIRAIDQSIMGSIDLRITFNVLLDRTLSQLSLDAAGILLLKQNSRLEYAAWRGFKEVKPAHIYQRIGDPQAGLAALDQRTIVVEDYNESLAWKSEIMEKEGLRGYCAVPLVAKGQVKGVLEVFTKSPLRIDSEWLEFLESLAGLAAISIENATLIETIQRTNTELTVAYDSTLMGWSQTVELRDQHKQGHSRRMADMTIDLARMLNMDEKELVHIYRGVLLHDIGSMAIPDGVILKEGPLSPEERAMLETHTVHAHRVIQSVEYLRPALDIPYSHHEKWDGSGYPRGLKGEEIPLAARIFAVVEVWDALTHDRPHRKALSEAEALNYIRKHAGSHFDPLVVEAFLKLIGK